MLLRVIRGQIPHNLRGSYYKNGPYMTARTTLSSLDMRILDEPGYIQKIEFANGIARYSAKLVDAPWRPFTVFGGPMIPPFSSSLLFNPANTNIIRAPDNRLLALYDGGHPYYIDANTLDTVTTSSHMWAPGFYNSHPKEGTFLRLNYDSFDHTRIGFGNDIDIRYDGFVYVHDYIATPQFYGFIDHKLEIGIGIGGIGSLLRNRKPAPQEIVLIDRQTKNIHKIPLVPDIGHKFSSHFIRTTFDPKTQELTLSAIMYPEYIRGPASIWTCVICTENMEVKRSIVIPKWCEFPVEINGQYFLSDIPSGGICEFRPGANSYLIQCVRDPECFYGEIAHDATSGYRMTYKYNLATRTTTLPIFDRHWMLVCELAFPTQFVPLGIHGTFIR